MPLSGGAGGRRRKGTRLIRLIPLVLAVIWGLNWPAVRIGLTAMPPFMLRAFGMACGAVILLALATALGRSLRVPRAMWWRTAVAGVLNIGLFNIAVAFAQLATSTSRAAILTFTMPLWSALFARLLLGERLDPARAWALAAGALGLALLAVPVFSGEGSLLGLFFPLLAAVSWASGTVFQKWKPIEADRMAATAWQLAAGATLSASGMLVTGTTGLVGPVDAEVVGALLYHVILANALAYFLWFGMLDRISATTTAMTTLMIPVVGVLGAMALIGDRPSVLDLAGFAAILVAAAIVLLGFRVPQRVPPRP